MSVSSLKSVFSPKMPFTRCGCRPSQQQQKKMFLTSCSCIFCSSCVKAATQPSCTSCGQRDRIKILPIDNSLPQQAMALFHKNEDSMAKINKRMAFQHGHWMKGLAIFSKAEAEYSKRVQDQRRSLVERKQEVARVELQLQEKEAVVRRLEKAVESLGLGGTSSPGGRSGGSLERRSLQGEKRGGRAREDRGWAGTGLPWPGGEDGGRGMSQPNRPLF